MNIKLLSLRLETIEEFLSASFDGFHDDIVAVIENKLDKDPNKSEMIAELEAIRTKYNKKKGAK